jgi:hypothetical protein
MPGERPPPCMVHFGEEPHLGWVDGGERYVALLLAVFEYDGGFQLL